MNIIQKLRIQVEPVDRYGQNSVDVTIYATVNGVQQVRQARFVEDHFKGFFDAIWQELGEEVKRQCTKPLDSTQS